MTRTTPQRPVDVEELFPELAALRRTGVRLHPRPGAPGPRDSSVGGPLLWPAGEPWPVCTRPHPRDEGVRPGDVHRHRALLAASWARPAGASPGPGPTDEERAELARLEERHTVPGLGDSDPIPMLAVAQLRTRDVPGLTGPPGTDLLQVFWCPFDAHGAADDGTAGTLPSVALRWRAEAAVTEPLDANPEPQVVGYAGYVPEPCVLDPEPVAEYPFEALLPPELRARIDAWEESLEDEDEDGEGDGAGGYGGYGEDDDEDLPTYQHDLSIPPGWKTGGYASWHLTGPAELVCAACGTPLEPLLTVASREWDGGSRSWVPREDRDVADVRYANLPTRVTVGRDGSLRIFTCPTDPAHPHRVDVQ